MPNVLYNITKLIDRGQFDLRVFLESIYFKEIKLSYERDKLITDQHRIKVNYYTVHCHRVEKKHRVWTRAATIHSPHDTIRIVILTSQYDTYRDTLFRLEIISKLHENYTMEYNYGIHHTSKFV